MPNKNPPAPANKSMNLKHKTNPVFYLTPTLIYTLYITFVQF